MCNRYTPPEEIEIERAFALGRQAPNRWWKPHVTPLALGPYIKPGDWDAWLHGTAAQANALIKLPPLGVLRGGAEKPEEEALLPAEQLAELKAER